MKGLRVVQSVTELIGNTAMIDLTPETLLGHSRLLAKLEIENIGGSVKDRLGMHLVERALATGKLLPNGIIIEPTAGNTGLGLAIAAQHYQVSLIVVVPERFSEEKQHLMKALGATVITTREEDGMDGAIKKARALTRELPNSYMPNQFENDWNPEAYKFLAQEMMHQVGQQIDEIVIGAGSGGTFEGVLRECCKQYPSVKGILVQPEGAKLVGEEQQYKIEGIGMDAYSPFMTKSFVSSIEIVSDQEAFYMAQKLAREKALLVGSSSGAAMVAALRRLRQAENEGVHRTIVTLFPDRAERYFQTQLFQ